MERRGKKNQSLQQARKRNANQCEMLWVECKVLESGPSNGLASVTDRIENFPPSWEKFRVIVMTIADGRCRAKLYMSFGCSKKCSESGVA